MHAYKQNCTKKSKEVRTTAVTPVPLKGERLNLCTVELLVLRNFENSVHNFGATPQGAISTIMTATARRKAARGRLAWSLATSVLFSSVLGSSSARYRGAFVTLPRSISWKSNRNGLQLPSECYVQQAVGRKQASFRGSIETAGATAAAQDTAAAEEEQEEEERELRLLTWMEVEARIERDIAKVHNTVISAALLR